MTPPPRMPFYPPKEALQEGQNGAEIAGTYLSIPPTKCLPETWARRPEKTYPVYSGRNSLT